MELADQMIETWRINARINLYLLGELAPEQLACPLSKGKTVSGQFSHVHNVRLMWLKVAAPDLHEPLQKLEATKSAPELIAALAASGEAMEKLLERAFGPEGKVKGFKPHPAAFVGYMIAHEANHRGHAELALRQAGMPLSDKVGYGQWEWGVR